MPAQACAVCLVECRSETAVYKSELGLHVGSGPPSFRRGLEVLAFILDEWTACSPPELHFSASTEYIFMREGAFSANTCRHCKSQAVKRETTIL